MSISIKLISKKLPFLTSVQPIMLSRNNVVLLHRRFLTSQILSRPREKFSERRCLTTPYQSAETSKHYISHRESECISYNESIKVLSRSSRPSQHILMNDMIIYSNHSKELLSCNTSDGASSLRLGAKPCLGTTDDIVIYKYYLSDNVAKNQKDDFTLLKCSSPKTPSDITSERDPSGRPTDEQLLLIRETLAKELPNIFVYTMNYEIYHRNILFINNIRGTQSVGILAYVRQLALFRAFGHFKFAYVRFEILKITSHKEDGTVRVRWRVRGIPGYKIIVNLFKNRVWRPSELIQNHQDTWYDGFSTFYVGGDGLIHKHVVDKMMPDDNLVAAKAKEIPLGGKLAALCVGVALSTKDEMSSANEPVIETAHTL